MNWLWIDYELYDWNYCSNMKKYELVWNSILQQADYMKMYELTEYCLVFIYLGRRPRAPRLIRGFNHTPGVSTKCPLELPLG